MKCILLFSKSFLKSRVRSAESRKAASGEARSTGMLSLHFTAIAPSSASTKEALSPEKSMTASTVIEERMAIRAKCRLSPAAGVSTAYSAPAKWAMPRHSTKVARARAAKTLFLIMLAGMNTARKRGASLRKNQTAAERANIMKINIVIPTSCAL